MKTIVKAWAYADDVQAVIARINEKEDFGAGWQVALYREPNDRKPMVQVELTLTGRTNDPR